MLLILKRSEAHLSISAVAQASLQLSLLHLVKCERKWADTGS